MAGWQTVAAGAIFVLALLGVLTRPRDLPEAAFAVAGGVLMLAVGVTTPTQAGATLVDHWNLFLFFLGLMAIAAIADTAGVFDWLAVRAARWSGGSARRLLINIVLLGTVLSAFLSNDATALILTPVVFTVSTRLGLSPRPYVFACAFVANAASWVLPMSNPINIVVLHDYPLALPAYLARLLPAALLTLAINLAALLFLFRGDLRARFPVEAVGRADAAKAAPAFFRTVAGWLIATAVVYVMAALRQFPLGIVAAASGAGVTLVALCYRRLSPRQVVRDISWALFGFVAGMLVLVQGLENVGATALLARLLDLGASGGLASAFVAVWTAAIGANLINNLPATFVIVAAIGHVSDPAAQGLLSAGTIVGADLGPNITIVGSLSTMLWLLLLRRRELEVTALDYLKVGGPVTALALVVAAVALWLTGR